MLERLRIGADVAFPVDDDGGTSVEGNRQCVRDTYGRNFLTAINTDGVDGKLSEKRRQQGRDIRQSQGSRDAARQLVR